MSYAEWQREPSTWDVAFRLHMPYRAPRSRLAKFVWRRRLWLETTFALSMMQPWEKVVVMCAVWLLLGLFVTTAYLYFPQHVRYLCGRARYYLDGELSVPAALKWSASYLGNASSPFAYAVNALSAHEDL
ncbi:uncharacterized protein B0H18DRAFT_883123 [Fomitopsis serialis]|uniref:uncharacterized protein n=1 Tax=Fomitopsis serialis TaxID=139415 RepID=UPI00200880B8|nr:uncharacterized protein B0H18DRAFT_883123 [Neoantrodia serialis]KAH9918097.1 hypothetical protein B0H18DRAFT_883123 [Neoantrodia serialis]